MPHRSMQRTIRAASRVLALALASTLAAGAAAAQEAQKIAVIDVGRVLEESRVGKAALQELKELSEAKQAQLDVAQEEAKGINDRIEQGRMSLSEDKLAELRKELQRKVIALQRQQDDANREIEEAQRERFGRIERQIMPVIQQVGAEMGFTLIFKKFQSGLLFARDEIDITDVILQRFDQVGAQGS